MKSSVVLALIASALLITPSRGSAQVLETLSAEAVLSGNTPVATGRSSRPVDYSVNFGVTFDSITDLTFFFVFSADDPLDPGECLEITGGYPSASGFCAVGPSSQLQRTLTFPCGTFPDVCAAYLDGSDAGQIIASPLNTNPAGRPKGRVSVTIESFTVTVSGVLSSQ